MQVQNIDVTTHGYGVVNATMTPLPKGYEIEIVAGSKKAAIYTPDKPYDLAKFVKDRLFVFNEVIILPPTKRYEKKR